MNAKRKNFISSTVEDLKEEREYLLKKIKELSNDYIVFEPYLSEYSETFHFTERELSMCDSVEICMKKVQECNYYVLLIKDNYNATCGLSVTELEYIKAKELHKPIFAFVLESENRKAETEKFVERISNEKWRFIANDKCEIFENLQSILNELDSSTYVGEWPSDCIIVSKGTVFTKSWTIKNTGNQVWKNRYMKHIVPATNMVPFRDKIEMPEVRPDEEYEFKVSYTVKKEGVTHSRWKMYNENGQECFSSNEYKGLWFDVNVRS